jgi:peptidyl-prolyl cis-trans isomerase SurA
MKKFLTLVVVLLSLSAVAAQAAEKQATRKITNEGIAVVVNDEPITVSDVFERLKLIIVSSGVPNNPDIQERVKAQVINMLIDERLQMQEARELGIKVAPEEIANGFATIANNNKIPPEKFQAMLARDGISKRTLDRQIEAQLAWGKVVQRKIRPQVDVTETDIDERLKMIEASIGKTQYGVAEIFLPVEKPENDAEVLALAQKLIGEIKGKRAPFQQVAAQFSQESAAARGGDLGWVQDSDLAPELAQALSTMNAGDLSEPVRTLTGYYILLLRGKRSVSAENIPSRDAILEQVGTERLDRQQRRHLMNLKAEAFIDRRV